MQKEVQTETKKVLKKITTDIIKMKAGDKVEGKLIGKTTGPWLDKATGEEKELTRLFFEKADGTKFILFEDGGLRNALANAMVKEGEFVVIEKLEKTDLGGGRSVNQYDIYQYSN